MNTNHNYRNNSEGFAEKRMVFNGDKPSGTPPPAPKGQDAPEDIYGGTKEEGEAEFAAYMDNMEAMQKKSGADERAEEVIAAAKKAGVDTSGAMAGLEDSGPKDLPVDTTTQKTKDDISLAAKIIQKRESDPEGKIIQKRESDPEGKSGADERAEEVIAAAKKAGVDTSGAMAGLEDSGPKDLPVASATSPETLQKMTETEEKRRKNATRLPLMERIFGRKDKKEKEQS